MKLHNRSIRAEYFADIEFRDKVPDCQTREIFVGLWMLADDSGCLYNSPRGIKYTLYPSDDKVGAELVADSIASLREAGCVVGYEADGKHCLYICNFHKHQTLFNPCKPEVPLPSWIKFVPSDKGQRSGRYVTDHNLNTACEQPDITGCIPFSSTSFSNSLQVPDEKAKKTKTENDYQITPDEQICLDIMKSITSWTFDLSKDVPYLRELIKDFPDIDISETLRGFKVYSIDQPYRSPRSGLRTWLGKDRENGRNRKGAARDSEEREPRRRTLKEQQYCETHGHYEDDLKGARECRICKQEKK